jgi:tryptophan 2,3-dioxygenase
MTSDEKVENLLFVIYVQNQRHEYWMKVVREIKVELEKLREEMGDDGHRSQRKY